MYVDEVINRKCISYDFDKYYIDFSGLVLMLKNAIW